MVLQDREPRPHRSHATAARYCGSDRRFPGTRRQEDDGERQAIAREQTQLILASLAPKQSAVLVAAKIAGFEYAEIAEELGEMIADVKQTASRAMRRLRSLDARR